ncbi:MAG: hypothetical protein WCK89_02945 [bacterium]
MLPMPSSIMPGHESGGETTTYADWVEASVLFSREAVSKADVRDYFYEENTFQREKTDEAVDNIWSELVRRRRVLRNKYPVTPRKGRLELTINWDSCPAYSFCLLVSYAKGNKAWMQRSCNDYPEQGCLFEQVTSDALRKTFTAWEVDRTGWSAETPTRLSSCINMILGKLGECPGAGKPRSDDKDGAVDILCYRTFSDCRGDYPVFFVQCSTGNDWIDKRGQNVIPLWKDWIGFRAPNLLSRAFAVPFSLCDDAFLQTQVRVDGLVLDRIRLFSGTQPEAQWLAEDTRLRIIDWLKKKLATLDGACLET